MWSRNSGVIWIGLLVLTGALFAGWMMATPVAAQDTPEPAAGAVAAADIQPETCVTCHSGAGDSHQSFYDSLYQDGVIQISDLAYAYTAPDTTTVTFKAT